MAENDSTYQITGKFTGVDEILGGYRSIDASMRQVAASIGVIGNLNTEVTQKYRRAHSESSLLSRQRVEDLRGEAQLLGDLSHRLERLREVGNSWQRDWLGWGSSLSQLATGPVSLGATVGRPNQAGPGFRRAAGAEDVGWVFGTTSAGDVSGGNRDSDNGEGLGLWPDSLPSSAVSNLLFGRGYGQAVNDRGNTSLKAMNTTGPAQTAIFDSREGILGESALNSLISRNVGRRAAVSDSAGGFVLGVPVGLRTMAGHYALSQMSPASGPNKAAFGSFFGFASSQSPAPSVSNASGLFPSGIATQSRAVSSASESNRRATQNSGGLEAPSGSVCSITANTVNLKASKVSFEAGASSAGENKGGDGKQETSEIKNPVAALKEIQEEVKQTQELLASLGSDSVMKGLASRLHIGSAVAEEAAGAGPEVAGAAGALGGILGGGILEGLVAALPAAVVAAAIDDQMRTAAMTERTRLASLEIEEIIESVENRPQAIAAAKLIGQKKVDELNIGETGRTSWLGSWARSGESDIDKALEVIATGGHFPMPYEVERRVDKTPKSEWEAPADYEARLAPGIAGQWIEEQLKGKNIGSVEEFGEFLQTAHRSLEKNKAGELYPILEQHAHAAYPELWDEKQKRETQKQQELSALHVEANPATKKLAFDSHEATTEVDKLTGSIQRLGAASKMELHTGKPDCGCCNCKPEGVTPRTKNAAGGLVKQTHIGQLDPGELILPLTRVNDMLRAAGVRGGGSGHSFTFHIDASGASAGVEERVKAAVMQGIRDSGMLRGALNEELKDRNLMV